MKIPIKNDTIHILKSVFKKHSSTVAPLLHSKKSICLDLKTEEKYPYVMFYFSFLCLFTELRNKKDSIQFSSW